MRTTSFFCESQIFIYICTSSHNFSDTIAMTSYAKAALTAALTFTALSSPAVAPYPLPVDYTAPDGSVTHVLVKGNEYTHYFLNASTLQKLRADASGYLIPMSDDELSALKSTGNIHTNALGLHEAYIPSSGSPRICVILVEFSDVKVSIPDPASYYSRALNTEGFSDNGHPGSVRDYFKAQSSGSFTPQFDVYGPVTLSSARKNYSSTANNAYKMVHEGADAINAQVDFSIYDLNSNGDVNHICIIFAGQGANFGTSNAPWPHNSNCPTGLFSRKKVDGKILNHYMCVSEIGYTTPEGIGTFIHELGHALGLPDLYNTTAIGSDTPNWWSIMDVGSYLDNSTAPCNYSAYERTALGWHSYTPLTAPADVKLRPMAEHNFACVIETGRDRDFYVLENRPATGWDRALPGSGMLIWHIDGNDQNAISSTPNNNSSHLLVDLVRADNSWQDALQGDPWPGSSGNTAFTSSSTPAMTRWSSTASNASREPVSGKEVTNIALNPSTHLITFQYMGGNSSSIVDPAPEPEDDTILFTTLASPPEGGIAYITDDTSCTSYRAAPNEFFRIHAQAAEGYKFDYWQFNGNRRPYMANYLMQAEKSLAGTYIAVFVPDPAAINSTETNAPQWTLNRLTLTLMSPTAQISAVYSASGATVASPISSTQRTVTLPAPGIYILVIDGHATRIVANP